LVRCNICKYSESENNGKNQHEIDGIFYCDYHWEELEKQAKALFNSDKSPLCFMVESGGSIGPSKVFTPIKKKWYNRWK
jgi:hypothetical protein